MTPAFQRDSRSPWRSLGSYFYDPAKSGEDANIYTNNAACRFFEETQQSVCYLFLQFYTAHNGEKFFGLPISEVRVIDGRLVQVFQAGPNGMVA